ncbi:hypothetical protein [Deinococcus sp. NW-56]|uniref:hypothetical protein n=1 Tax=Deinococcus sp. NW-56 TaxID=2080419 RepID=UPI000CF44744|nr:hypothetical protein [Deinococcus sp. NW-56]
MQNINVQASIIEATAQGDEADTERLTELVIEELEARYPDARITVEEADSTLSDDEFAPIMAAALAKF